MLISGCPYATEAGCRRGGLPQRQDAAHSSLYNHNIVCFVFGDESRRPTQPFLFTRWPVLGFLKKGVQAYIIRWGFL